LALVKKYGPEPEDPYITGQMSFDDDDKEVILRIENRCIDELD
jgi:hypothetical protein